MNPCRRYLQWGLAPHEIERRRRQIYLQILPSLHHGPDNIARMTNEDLERLFWLYDSIFLQGEVRRYLSTTQGVSFEIRFGQFGNRGEFANFGRSGEIIETVGISGHCQVMTGPGFCHHALFISRPIHTELFRRRPWPDAETTNGIQCHDQLGCLMITLEHEIGHLIVNIWCRSQNDNHGPHFMVLVRNLFGHTDSRHNLGRGLSEDADLHIAKVKAHLRPGMVVPVYDPWEKAVVPYRVVEAISPHSENEFIAHHLEDGQYYSRSLLDILLPEEIVERSRR